MVHNFECCWRWLVMAMEKLPILIKEFVFFSFLFNFFFQFAAKTLNSDLNQAEGNLLWE